jgi:hypothetical protein
MPETDFSRVRMRANKYARQAAAAAANIQYGKGRPRRGTEVGPTPTRSLRLPETIWKALEREAQEKATTVHALLRELVVAHVSNLTASPKDVVRNR